LKIKTSKPECIWNLNALLGEGTMWLPNQRSVFFVDTKKKNIFIYNVKKKKKKTIKVNKEIGFIIHIKNDIFILGLQSELRIMNLKNKKIIYSIPIESDQPMNRINDGKVDEKGRLWFGTMDNLERNKKFGALYCLDCKLNIHKVDKNYFITNGPAFLNHNTFYHTDSRKRVIYKITIDKNFKIKEKKKFLSIKKIEGSPDGMTTDIKNNLWVCHYGGGKITTYNSKGKRIYEIIIPAKNITNCVFGGINNNELFISTARKGLTPKDRKKYPLSGSLFKVKLNIKGKKSQSYKLLTI